MLGLSLQELLILGAGGAMALSLALVARRSARAGLVAWLVVLVAVPVWCGVSLIFYFQPASLLGIVIIGGLLAARPRIFGPADLAIAFFFLACLLPIAVGGGSLSTVFGAVTLWLVAFTIGRIVYGAAGPTWVNSCIAVVFTLISIGAVLEFVTDVHLFEHLGPSNGLHATWGPIQERGGVARSEGAFGHSIALGSSIAAALPMALGSSFRFVVRQVMVVVMMAGVLVTFSRASIIAAALGILLMAAFGARHLQRRQRVATLVMGLVGAVASVPVLTGVLQRAGSEASGSAAYRNRLLELIPAMKPLGRSTAMTVSPTGSVSFQGYQSIDSQLLFTGLTYGWIALALVVIVLVAAMAKVVTSRAPAPIIAIVAQIPVLAVVALITQYSMWFWFVAGLAIASARDHAFSDATTADGVDPSAERSAGAINAGSLDRKKGVSWA